MKTTVHPNIPEFYDVGQNEAVVTKRPNELRTDGMTTCSALVVIDEENQMLAHVDAGTNAHDLARFVRENFSIDNTQTKFYLIPGDGSLGSTKLSEQKIHAALQVADVAPERISELPGLYRFFMRELVVRNGHFYEDERRIPLSHIIEPGDGYQYVFTTNAEKNGVSQKGDKLLYAFNVGSAIHTKEYENAIVGAAQFKGSYTDPNLVGIYRRQEKTQDSFSRVISARPPK